MSTVTYNYNKAAQSHNAHRQVTLTRVNYCSRVK